MAKIDENLVKDEKVLARAVKSPLVLVAPIVEMVLGLIIGIAANGFLLGLVLAVVVGLFLGGFRTILAYLTDELAITTKRVYGRCKPKLIGGEELDMPLDKINSLAVSKGLFGSIFGYSKITIKSFGEGWIFPSVKNASELKTVFYENQK